MRVSGRAGSGRRSRFVAHKLPRMSRWLLTLVVALVLPGCVVALHTLTHRVTPAFPLHGLAPFAQALSGVEGGAWQEVDVSSADTLDGCEADPGSDDEQLLDTADQALTESRWTVLPCGSSKVPPGPFLEGLKRPPRVVAA
jgi:hypothetical protein